MHRRGRALGKLIHSHGLQRTLAKPPQLHPLGAATRKGEMLWCPEPHVLPSGKGWGRSCAPVPLLGHPLAAPLGGFLRRFFPLCLT